MSARRLARAAQNLADLLRRESPLPPWTARPQRPGDGEDFARPSRAARPPPRIGAPLSAVPAPLVSRAASLTSLRCTETAPVDRDPPDPQIRTLEHRHLRPAPVPGDERFLRDLLSNGPASRSATTAASPAARTCRRTRHQTNTRPRPEAGAGFHLVRPDPTQVHEVITRTGLDEPVQRSDFRVPTPRPKLDDVPYKNTADMREPTATPAR